MSGDAALEEIGRDVDGEGQDDRVEEEPDDALNDADPSHPFRRDIDVRAGKRAAYDEGLIEEFHPAWLSRPGELEAAMIPARLLREVDACVVQPKHHLKEGPSAQDRRADERQMSRLRPACQILHRAELPDDRRYGRASRHNPQEHQHPLVLVLWPGLNARVALRIRDHRRDHDEERPSADIPSDEKARRLADVEAKREI